MDQNKMKWTPEAEEWLSEHPSETAEALDRVWHLSEQAKPEPWTLEEEKARKLRESVLAIPQDGDTRVDDGRVVPLPTRSATGSSTRLRLLSWAAAAALFGATLVGWYMTRPTVYEAPYGDFAAIQLDDGSEVTLNSGSKLILQRGFGDGHRDVELEGEGFFSVTSDGVPFRVATFNANVEVLGTRFNVRAWQGALAPETHVILEEGRVQLGGSGGDAVELSAGEMSRVVGESSRPTPPAQTRVERDLAWRTGGIAFTDAPLGDLLSELERRFEIKVTVSPGNVASTGVTLYLDQTPSPERVLESLEAVLPCMRSPSAGGYLLTCS